ncbi:MAG: hypothetical protein QXR30_03725 [Candidatus Woesearchaeota archaeon]
MYIEKCLSMNDKDMSKENNLHRRFILDNEIHQQANIYSENYYESTDCFVNIFDRDFESINRIIYFKVGKNNNCKIKKIAIKKVSNNIFNQKKKLVIKK